MRSIWFVPVRRRCCPLVPAAIPTVADGRLLHRIAVRSPRGAGRHWSFTIACPGSVIAMTPPQTHWQVSVWRSAGWFAIVTTVDPGAHGVTVFGTHGAGVSTPFAAAVAAAVGGNASDMHGPNAAMFVIG